MRNQTTTIRKVIKQLNQKEGTDGGFWLPNIQRNFIWKEEQTERLFDSLMRDYPIGTLLIWKTKSKIKHRKFIDNYKSSIQFTDFYVPANNTCKLLVLDGQQRLQSLFIGLSGSYNGKELYFDILSGLTHPPEDIKYNFKFKKKAPTDRWIKIKNIVFGEKDIFSDQADIIQAISTKLTPEQRTQIGKNVAIIHKVFKTEDRIVYQEFDSVDQPELYREDDVVEIFIRANSGGTPLGKSDLLFSLLTSSWDEAEEKMESLLEDLNKDGYAFTRDFILKTCLTLLNKGATYKVEKFREKDVRDEIIKKWSEIESSIQCIKDFLHGNTYLRSKHALKSYLPLIPIIYFHYHYTTQWYDVKYLNHYILKTLLAGAFSGNPDSLIDNCITTINNTKSFNNKDIFNTILKSGRNLEISKDDLLQQNYSKRNDLHLIFNLWYKDTHYHPSYSANTLNIDHIFPTSIMRKVKHPRNPKLMKYKKQSRDQIANLMLLTREENGAGGKSDTEPYEWFKNKNEAYLKKHLIPNNPELWKIDHFDQFIKERKKLIVKKFKNELHLLIREKRK